jgi:hypothetical protein
MDKEKIKPFGWGAAVGAILLLILAFSTGWVVTSSTAKQNAEELAEKAIDKQMAEVCAYQFKQTTNSQKKIKKLEEMEYSWDRADYIKNHGWATMPGDDSVSSGVADNCAKILMENLDKKEKTSS